MDNNWLNETSGETGGEIIPIYTIPDNLMLMDEREGFDQYIFRLNVYRTEDFQVKYQMSEFPLLMQFEQWNYLGVEVLTAMENQYIFTTKCWASPSADPLRLVPPRISLF